MIPGSDAAIGMGAHPDRGARDLLKVLFETDKTINSEAVLGLLRLNARR